MTDIIKIPANTRARLMAVRDEAVDKFDVVDFGFKFMGAGFPEPWAYYKFEEPDESELWVDATGQEHHLRRNLGYAALPTSTTGKIGNGLSFTGTPAIVLDNEYVGGEYFKSGVGIGDPFSWAAWVQVSGSSTYDDLMDFNIEYVALWIDDSGQVVYYPCFGDPQTVAVDCRGSLHHLVVVSDGSTVTIYFDNEEVDIYAITEECYCEYDEWFSSITIGSSYRPSGESVVDEFGLWTVALTPDQVAYLWNNGAGRTLYP